LGGSGSAGCEGRESERRGPPGQWGIPGTKGPDGREAPQVREPIVNLVSRSQ
jgi:hypothetical protein